MKLFDRQGIAHDVPDEQAGEALKSGQFGLPKGEAVPVKLADGQIGTVPGEHVAAALDGGAAIISHEEHRAAVLDAKYGGIVGHAAAAGEGFARGATLGISDPLAVGVARLIGGDEAREATRTHLAEVKEAHPYVAGAGEIAGAVAPILASGGTAAPGVAAAEGAATAARAAELGAGAYRTAGVVAEAGKAAEAARGASAILTAAKVPMQVVGAPTRALSAVGDIVEHGVSKLLGKEATTAVGRIVQAGTKQAARGAVEGGIFGVGNEISEDTLGNTSLNGEKLLAALGHGALLGGALAGGLGAGGQVTREVVGRIAPKLAGAADFQAFKALNPMKAYVKEAERIPGGGAGIGRRMLDDGIIKAGDSIEEIAPKVAAARDAAGEKIGALLKAADEAGYEGPRLLNVYKGLAETEERLSKLPSMNRSALEKLGALRADFEGALGIVRPPPDAPIDAFAHYGKQLESAKFSFQQAQDLRARIDDAIKWSSSPMAPVNEMTEALKGVRGALEGEIERAGDTAGKKLGDAWIEDYRGAKLAYRQYATADRAAQNAISARSANRVLSPSDYGIGAAGAVIGHGVLSPVTGLASAYAHHVIRERGNATAAVLLDKISALSAVRRAAEMVDREVDRGVARILSDEAPARRPKLRHFTGADEHEERRKAVVRAHVHGEEHEANIDAATQDVAEHAPGVAAAFKSAAMRSTSVLASHLPSIGPTPSLTPQLDQREPSDHEKELQNGVYEVLHEPTLLLHAVHVGDITPDQVQAVEKATPALYKEMTDKVRAELLTLKKPLTYQRELAIGVLLQQPFNQTQTPEFTQAMQQNYQKPAAQTAPPGSKGRKAQQAGIDIAGSHSLTGLSKEHRI